MVTSAFSSMMSFLIYKPTPSLSFLIIHILFILTKYLIIETTYRENDYNMLDLPLYHISESLLPVGALESTALHLSSYILLAVKDTHFNIFSLPPMFYLLYYILTITITDVVGDFKTVGLFFFFYSHF